MEGEAGLGRKYKGGEGGNVKGGCGWKLQEGREINF